LIAKSAGAASLAPARSQRWIWGPRADSQPMGILRGVIASPARSFFSGLLFYEGRSRVSQACRSRYILNQASRRFHRRSLAMAEVVGSGTETAPSRAGVFAVIIRVLVVLLAIAIVWLVATRLSVWVGGGRRQTTDDAYLESDVTPLAAHVSGYVQRVLVGDFETVRKGQALVELADADYRAQVAQAQAGLDEASAVLEVLSRQRVQQTANVDALRAALGAANATVHLNRLELERQRGLFAQGHYTPEQAVDQADAADKQAGAVQSQQRAQIIAAQRQLDTIDAQVLQAQAAVAQSRAALDLVKINLGYTRIVAPLDGVVGQRQVREGQYVSVGTQVIAHVALPNVWVVANYRETQMTRIRVGQAATIRVDAFPGLALTGHVQSWAPASGSRFSLLPPDNATGNFTKIVQRLSVKIVLDSASDQAVRALLRPGMSVVVTVDTASDSHS
jgi:membrane fusion protein (multidrug efflux system)